MVLAKKRREKKKKKSTHAVPGTTPILADRLTRDALSSVSSSTSSSDDLPKSSSSSSLIIGGSSWSSLDFLRDTPFALPLDCRLADIMTLADSRRLYGAGGCGLAGTKRKSRRYDKAERTRIRKNAVKTVAKTVTETVGGHGENRKTRAFYRSRARSTQTQRDRVKR